jgi:ribosome-associated translation inhibitor RaiA
MPSSIQITFHHARHSDSLDAFARRLASGLVRKHRQIIRCHVIIDREARGHSQAGPCTVKVVVNVPGHTIVARGKPASTESYADPHAAISHAFESAARQLTSGMRRRKRRRRHRQERAFAIHA